jgi:hypothetical protein
MIPEIEGEGGGGRGDTRQISLRQTEVENVRKKIWVWIMFQGVST